MKIRKAKQIDTCGQGDEVWIKAKLVHDNHGSTLATVKVEHSLSHVNIPYDKLYVEDVPEPTKPTCPLCMVETEEGRCQEMNCPYYGMEVG